MNAVAKITAKGQTTVPKEIREVLNVKAGDLIAWEKTGDGVVQVRRILPPDLEYLRAVQGTMDEWASQADEEAYRDL